MNKDSKLIAEAYFHKIKENFGQGANLDPSAESDMEFIPSVNDEQAYDQFIQKFLEQGGNKTIANFLKDTDVDFSDKGNNEPVPTLNGLLKASKLKRKPVTPGAPDYNLEQALRYTASVAGAKFAAVLGNYIEKKKTNRIDQDDESADRTDQARDDKSAIDYEREDRAAAERDKWTKGQGKDGKFHF